MSVVVYQNWIAQNYPFTTTKDEYYKYLIERVNRGEISMNQSYKFATNAAPFSEANGGLVDTWSGTFQEWVENAKSEGWLSTGYDILGTILGKPQASLDPQQTMTADQYANALLEAEKIKAEQKRKRNNAIIVVSSIVAATILVVVLVKANAKGGK